MNGAWDDKQRTTEQAGVGGPETRQGKRGVSNNLLGVPIACFLFRFLDVWWFVVLLWCFARHDLVLITNPHRYSQLPSSHLVSTTHH